MRQQPAKIVVLGGGFGGLYTAMTLQKELAGSGLAEVTLVDRRNYFTFTPFLPEVAAGTLGPADVTYPLRFLTTHNRPLRFIQGELRAFDLISRQIHTETSIIAYDYLVVSLGSVPSYFNNPHLEAHSLPLHSVDDALAIRNHVIHLFEEAVVEPDPVRRRQLLTIVVAGAGPCGVEVAAELHLLIQTVLLKYYPVDPSEVRVLLVSPEDRILVDLAQKLARAGQQFLMARGIDVRLNTRVTDASERHVQLNGRELVPTHTLIWTAGVTPNPVLVHMPVPKNGRGAVKVDQFLNIPEHPEVYVIGGGAAALDHRHDRPYPNLASVAIRQGVRAAANIINCLQGRAKESFHFDFTGNIVGLGRGAALVNLLGIPFHGRLGWWFYRMTYLQRLFSLRSKVSLILTLARNALFERDISCEVWPDRNSKAKSWLEWREVR